MLTNFTKTVIYTGVTSDLVKRVYQHKNRLVEGFAKRYSTDLLVYYEVFDDIELAIAREKQIKGGSRKSKNKLVDGANPEWRDLYEEIIN